LKRRLTIAAGLVLVWALLVQLRLVQLQVFRHTELLDRANDQLLDLRPIPAKRGKILDRYGRVLASSVAAQSITAVPNAVEDPRKATEKLCAVLDCPDDTRQQLLARLSTKRDFAWVRRRVTPEDASQVAALGLKGINFVTEDKRFYPNRALAAHVLGFVGIDHTGLGGIESRYDEVIAGAPGSVRVQLDANGKNVGTEIEQPPTEGATLELTIDETIQHIAERELRRGLSENKALAGCAIVLDPWTGEILAMASLPTFNPNSYALFSDDQRRNRCVQDTYEPGSTFKLVTASAALEQGLIEPDDIVDVSGGKIVFGPGDVVRDTHDYKRLTFSDVIVKSSNVGAIKVALRLGPERMTEYVRRFGFGMRSSRQDFPSETRGIVWPADKLTDRSLARVSIGYQVGVTALQMASAASSIANGGELLGPRVVRAVWRDKQRVLDVSRTVVNRTVPAHVASQMTAIMEGVVTDGTATMAQIPGYTVAGKTGTATKVKDGRYIDEYNASFVGFVPSRKPVYTIIVVVDSPKGPNGYYGGPVAGPIFKRIAEELLRYGGVAPTIGAPPPLLVKRETAAPHERPVSNQVVPSERVSTALDVGRDGYLPDMTGMSAREVAGALARLGLTPTLFGSGLVYRQKPAAGTPLETGARVTLWLDRQPFPDGAGGSE
jgi:cell division protein FtsI (penicillin-binding protein 3)